MATAPKAVGGAVPVNIIVDGTGAIKVDPDTFWVSKGTKQEVEWACRSGDYFTVDFNKNGSPFSGSHFDTNSPQSGPVDPAVQPGPKIYNYTVKVGNQSLDPGGGVNP